MNTVAPVLSTSDEFGTLACTTGTWTGATSYAYQFKRAGASISGGTATPYTCRGNDGAVNGDTDFGPTMKCTVTATGPGGSTSVDSNTLAFLPSLLAKTRLFSDPATLVNGAVSSFPCTGVGPTEAQGTGSKQPVKSATSLNGTPGVTFDGVNDVLIYPAFDLSAEEAVLEIVAIQHASPGGALAVIAYHTPLNITANRGFILTNGEVATQGRVGGYAHGVDGAGFGNSVSSARILEAADGPVVLTVCYDTAVTDGCSYMGIDGAVVSDVTLSNSCAPGNLNHCAGYWGTSSDGISYPWGGKRGVRVIYSGRSLDAGALRVQQFIAWRTGKVPL